MLQKEYSMSLKLFLKLYTSMASTFASTSHIWNVSNFGCSWANKPWSTVFLPQNHNQPKKRFKTHMCYSHKNKHGSPESHPFERKHHHRIIFQTSILWVQHGKSTNLKMYFLLEHGNFPLLCCFFGGCKQRFSFLIPKCRWIDAGPRINQGPRWVEDRWYYTNMVLLW